MHTDVKYTQMMCEYVFTSCFKVLWKETLRRSLSESSRSEIFWLSKIRGVTVSEAAVSVQRGTLTRSCAQAHPCFREPFLGFYSPVLLSHSMDKMWSSSLGRPQGRSLQIAFWIQWVGLYPLPLSMLILLYTWWLGQLKQYIERWKFWTTALAGSCETQVQFKAVLKQL